MGWGVGAQPPTTHRLPPSPLPPAPSPRPPPTHTRARARAWKTSGLYKLGSVAARAASRSMLPPTSPFTSAKLVPSFSAVCMRAWWWWFSCVCSCVCICAISGGQPSVVRVHSVGSSGGCGGRSVGSSGGGGGSTSGSCVGSSGSGGGGSGAAGHSPRSTHPRRAGCCGTRPGTAVSGCSRPATAPRAPAPNPAQRLPSMRRRQGPVLCCKERRAGDMSTVWRCSGGGGGDGGWRGSPWGPSARHSRPVHFNNRK